MKSNKLLIIDLKKFRFRKIKLRLYQIIFWFSQTQNYQILIKKYLDKYYETYKKKVNK